MNITAVLVLLFATLICLGPATAQTARPKGKPIMYKCVDTRGKTYYSDKMSTDCAKGIELSQTGRVIERPPVKAAPVNSKAAELDPTVSADKERRDRALMATYTNIEEIDSARERTLALPMQGIKTNEARLARANSNLSELKKEAEALVAKNKPVPEQLTDDIAVREREVATLEVELAQRRTNADEIRARFELDKVRFSELKDGTRKNTLP